MSTLPTHCPFCNRQLTSENKVWSGCYEKDCSFNFEISDNGDTHFYDLYVNINHKALIFQSEIRDNNTGISQLFVHDGEIITSINSYTEPTAQAILQAAHRLFNLKAFT